MEPRIADTIVMRALAGQIPYARNARTHTPEQIAQIMASIRAYGFTNPVLVDEAGGIIAGHGRVLAAGQLGLVELPTIELGYLTEEQQKAYRIADNKLALNSGWDEELLRLELSALVGSGYDLSLTGFSEIELDELLAPDGSSADSSRIGDLAEHFGVPPFSVLNAREGWWQERKNAWIALGIQSELGRGALANDRAVSGSARINDAAESKRRYSAAPGGSLMPARDKQSGRLVRGDSRARPIPGSGAKRVRAADAAQG